MKPMRLGMLAVVLTCLCGCTTVVKTVMFHHPQIKSRFEPVPLDTNVTGEAWIDYAGEGTNQITVLHVKADNHYSLGYHHGKLLGPQVAAGVEDVLSGAENLIPKQARRFGNQILGDRKSTRLNSSHMSISYAVFCLKKKKRKKKDIKCDREEQR